MINSNEVVLKGRRMMMSDYAFTRLGITVPAGTTLDDLLQVSYFRNSLHMVKPGAQIDVLSDDYVLDVSLRVLSTTKITATTRVIRDSSQKPPKPSAKQSKVKPVAGEPTAEWGGPAHKYRVVLDGGAVETGFGSLEDAQAAADKLKEPA